ncbi:hypothetical protein ACWEWU_12195 [Staphylococcus xylosus]|uniref:hypothetical protein n=1 Tax=Staphylococcus xylosus TaxID=1288 RepID=UPI0015F7FB29|nr:hypothetical protein [Staphylococcus xylosus]
MRTFMTLLCLPFITLIVAETLRDFHVGIVVTVLLSFLTYLFWDKFFEALKKTETCSNK